MEKLELSFNTIMMCSIIPIILLVICIGYKVIDKKSKNLQNEVLQGYYWLKNSKSIGDSEQSSYNRDVIINCSIVGGVFILSVVMLINLFGIYDFDTWERNVFVNAIWDILGVNIEIVMIIGILVSLKKEYYLGINIKDAIRVYGISNHIIIVFWSSVTISLIFAIENINIIQKSATCSLLISMFKNTVFIWIWINVMLLIYKTIALCINNNRKEMKAFKCMRYKVAYDYYLSEERLISRGVAETVSTYLIEEIIIKYNRFEKRAGEITDIYFNSLMVCNNSDSEKQRHYSTVLNKKGRAILVKTSLIGLIVTGTFAYIDGIGSFQVIVAIAIEVILVGTIITIGYKNKLWGIFAANRAFWVFQYGSNKRYEKIAAFGFCKEYSKGFEFIATIEDLLGFYKILLYSESGAKQRKIVINQIREEFKKDIDKKIRNTILLLLYYFEYEKCYIDNKEKLKINIMEKNKKKVIEIVKKKTQKMIKKEEIFCFHELSDIIQDLNSESAEYKLADSILKHIYKEPKKEKGEINPRELKNYKFEEYYKFIIGKKFSQSK